MRLDKWLWAARFFKTRSIASAAVDGGKVKVNDATVKPAKDVKIGDRIKIRAGEQDWEVMICGLNEQRHPATDAQLLYLETPDSQQRRLRIKELNALAPVSEMRGRPTKRDRRLLEGFRKTV